MQKQPCVYVLSNQPRGTLYVGVTSDLAKRVWQHKNKFSKGFTSDHGLTRLVYYELHGSMEQAILREKRIKRWRRLWKLRLIERFNNEWADLYQEIL